VGTRAPGGDEETAVSLDDEADGAAHGSSADTPDRLEQDDLPPGRELLAVVVWHQQADRRRDRRDTFMGV
jgi:hypothetical protein